MADTASEYRHVRNTCRACRHADPAHCRQFAQRLTHAVHLSLGGLCEIVKASKCQHDQTSCQSVGNIRGLVKAALLDLQQHIN